MLPIFFNFKLYYFIALYTYCKIFNNFYTVEIYYSEDSSDRIVKRGVV